MSSVPSSQDLCDAIDQLHALSTATLAQLLKVVAAYEASDAWHEDGAASMSAWLMARLGASRETAVEWVRVAQALAGLPALAQAFAAGELSWDQLRVATRMATPESDETLAREARGMSVPQLERLARRPRESREKMNRCLRLRWRSDVLHLSGRLPGSQGAVVARALDDLASQTPPDPETGTFEPLDQRHADALVELAAGEAPANVIVHVDADTLLSDVGSADVEGGPAIGAESVRRLGCDGVIRLVVRAQDGRSLGVGRGSRKVPWWLMRELRHRDQGCRFPGCERTRWLHAHHVRHWAHGGRTDTDNLLMLCGYHHRLVHEGGWQIVTNPNRSPRFLRPDGRPLITGPQPLRPEVRDRILSPALTGGP